MLNKLDATPTSNFQPIRLLDPGFFIEIHIFNGKQSRSRSVGFFRTVFAKTGHVVFSKRRNKSDFVCLFYLGFMPLSPIFHSNPTVFGCGRELNAHF